MSVAFRRESDEEHLEPKFEIPIPAGPNLVTPRGLDLMHARVGELEARAAAASDEDSIQRIARDLRYWRTRLATARLVPTPTGETVEFGCRILFRLDGQVRAITIVGDDEADPSEHRIAFSAPLARAMLGAEPGEFLAFRGRDDAIEILAIETGADR